jgi:hypothetical protein
MKRLPWFLVSAAVLGACSPESFQTPDAATTVEAGADAPVGDASDGDVVVDAGPPKWEILAPPAMEVDALSVRSPTDVWLAGGDANGKALVDHWTSGNHALDPSVSVVSKLTALAMKSDTDGLAVGNGIWVKYDGNGWTPGASSKGKLVGAWVKDKTSDYYVANALGYVFRWANGIFYDLSGSPKAGLTCRGMAALYVACNQGLISQWDGPNNAFVTTLNDGPPLGFDLLGIDRAGSTIVAVGTGGSVVDVSGSATKNGKTGVASNLNAVWVTPVGEAFAVGDGGIILRRASPSSTWELMPSPTSKNLYAIGGIVTLNPPTTTIFVGGDGVFLRWVR